MNPIGSVTIINQLHTYRLAKMFPQLQLILSIFCQAEQSREYDIILAEIYKKRGKIPKNHDSTIQSLYIFFVFIFYILLSVFSWNAFATLGLFFVSFLIVRSVALLFASLRLFSELTKLFFTLFKWSIVLSISFIASENWREAKS